MSAIASATSVSIHVLRSRRCSRRSGPCGDLERSTTEKGGTRMSKVALVIGGGTGIGYATARRLAGRGVSVMLSGRREEKLKAAEEQLHAEMDGAKVAFAAGDSSVEADAKRIV